MAVRVPVVLGLLVVFRCLVEECPGGIGVRTGAFAPVLQPQRDLFGEDHRHAQPGDEDGEQLRPGMRRAGGRGRGERSSRPENPGPGAAFQGADGDEQVETEYDHRCSRVDERKHAVQHRRRNSQVEDERADVVGQPERAVASQIVPQAKAGSGDDQRGAKQQGRRPAEDTGRGGTAEQ